MFKYQNEPEKTDTTQHSKLNLELHTNHTPYRLCCITGLDASYCIYLPSQDSNYNDILYLTENVGSILTL